MLPIVAQPTVVTKYARNFKKVFANNIQYQHFKHYLIGLMVVENVTITSMNERFVNSSDQSSLNRFLTLANWSEEELNEKRLKMLERNKRTKSKPAGAILIDDSLLHKTGKHIDGVYKYYDYINHNYTLAQDVVTSHYVDEETDYPINFRLYHRLTEEEDRKHLIETKVDPRRLDKEQLVKRLIQLLEFERKRKSFKTKIELALELVDDAERRGHSASVYLFDAWYLVKELADKIESYGKSFISKLKLNRKVFVNNRWYSITEYLSTIPKEAYREIEVKDQKVKYFTFTKVVQIRKLGKRRIVACYDNFKLQGEPFILVTNRKDWEAKKILQTWLSRWQVETFYRDAKQHLGLEDCQLRKMKGIVRHLYLVFLVHSLLQLTASQSILIRKVQSELRTVGEKCRSAAAELVRSLVFWISKQLATKHSPDVVFQLLLS